MRKVLWVLPWFLIASTIVLAVKFSDSVLEFGTSGNDSKIIFSGGEGVLQYNNTNDRFEYANDGSSFLELGAGVPAGERLFIASITATRGGSTVTIDWQKGPGSPWVNRVVRQAEGVFQVFTTENFFQRPPHCWMTSKGVTTFRNFFSAGFIRVHTYSDGTGGTFGSFPFTIWCMRGTVDA